MDSLVERNIHQQVIEITKCSICHETYTDPRILPCVHTYCFKCLVEFAKEEQPGDKKTCPLCRNEFEIPAQGIEMLHKNFFIEIIIKLGDSSRGNKQCDGCDSTDLQSDQKSGDTRVATMYCQDCGDRLCEECVNSHRRTKLTRNHELVNINEVSDVVMAQSASVRCEEHPEELIKLFCSTCDRALCGMCHIESHLSHKCSDIKKVADSCRGHISTDIGKMTEAMSECRKLIELQEENKVKLDRQADEVEKQICRQVDLLIQIINEAKKTLLEDLMSIKENQHKQIDEVIDQLQQHLVSAESFKMYADELKRRGTPVAVVQQTENLRKRTNQLTTLDTVKKTAGNLRSCDLHFEAWKWPEVAEKSIVGKIHQLNEAKFLLSTNEVKSIWGVTTLNNELYSSRWDDDEKKFIVDSHDIETLNFKCQLQQVTGLGKVNDMTFCYINQSLYTADVINQKVHRIMDREDTQWPVEDEPHSVSVNSAGNVLVTCQKVGKIKEFTSDGKSLRVTSLQSDIINPWHAVELTTDQLVVCHGEVGDPLHRVCEVNSSGRVLRSIGGSPGSDSRQFDVPLRLATVNGTIFVADFNNHRVVQLSSSLTFMREVVSGLAYPMRIWFDKRTSRLCVADNKYGDKKFISGHVKVYSV